MRTCVVNRRKAAFDVYIGRGSMWGNPFRIGPDGDRANVIALYREWLWEQLCSGRITRQQLLALDGKRLGCYCAPLPCHGDVLVKAVEWARQPQDGGDS